MNAREFEVIMKSEGLEMSQSVLIMLQEAKQHHQNIKRMTMYQHIPKIAQSYLGSIRSSAFRKKVWI